MANLDNAREQSSGSLLRDAKANWVVFVLVLLAALFHFPRALENYPVWHGDAAGFWPYVHSWASSGKLQNDKYESYILPITGRALDGNTYVHGFLTPLMLGYLAGDDYHHLHVVLVCVHLLALAIHFIGTGLSMRDDVRGGARLLILGSHLMLFTWSCADVSRPEIVTCLPVSIGLALLWNSEWSRSGCLFAACWIAVVFWFNPVPGALLAILIAASVMMNSPGGWSGIVRCACLTCCTAGFVVLIFVAFYPGDHQEFLELMLSVGGWNARRAEAGEFLAYFLGNPSRPFLLLPMLAGAVVMWRRAVTSPVGALWGGFSACIAMMLVFWFGGGLSPPRNYTVVPLLPVILTATVPAMSRVLHLGAAWSRLVNLLIMVGAVANLGAMVIDEARFCAYLHKGVKIEQVRREFVELRASRPVATIAASMIFFPVIGDDSHAQFLEATHLQGAEFLMMQQLNTGLSNPPAVDGYDLIKDCFVRGPVKLMGVRIGRVTPGYAYALYKRRV